MSERKQIVEEGKVQPGFGGRMRSFDYGEAPRIGTITKLRSAARRNPLATIGIFLVSLFVVFAIFAPLIAPFDPANIDLPRRLAPPSALHWFGTDELGRDILSRVIYGARLSMFVG